MAYSFGFKKQFAVEFNRFPKTQQDKITEFLESYSRVGLSDFSKYEGKISQSWSGNASQSDYDYAKGNHLWHYHIGLPTYYSKIHQKYKTSDWVLHFQWVNNGSHIEIVDIYSHYKSGGEFYLPKPESLE